MAIFPPNPESLIHEDVKALFRLADVTCRYRPDWLQFNLVIRRGRFYAEINVEPDQLQDLALAQFFVQGLIERLETEINAG